jgi:hypothetical protein
MSLHYKASFRTRELNRNTGIVVAMIVYEAVERHLEHRRRDAPLGRLATIAPKAIFMHQCAAQPHGKLLWITSAIVRQGMLKCIVPIMPQQQTIGSHGNAHTNLARCSFSRQNLFGRRSINSVQFTIHTRKQYVMPISA